MRVMQTMTPDQLASVLALIGTVVFVAFVIGLSRSWKRQAEPSGDDH
jgi:hypothetical protein